MSIPASLLSSLEPLRGMSAQRLEELAGHCRLETCPLGTDVMALPGIAGQFIYLLSGELKIVLLDGSMRLLVGGCDVALWPLGYKTVLPVSSKAITEVSLLRIDFDILDLMMTWDELVTGAPEVSASVLLPVAVDKMLSSAWAQFPPAHIDTLLSRFKPLPVRSGQRIIREGDAGDAYFLIQSGRCLVSRQVGGVPVDVAELKAGDAFGEEALLSGAPRNATVTMLSEGVLLQLDKPDFDRLMRAPLLQQIARPEAEARIAAGQAVWLDVRYPAEFVFDGLPGAINLPLNELRKGMALLDPSQTYIVYCRSGRRSRAATFLLAQKGLQAFCLQEGDADE